MKKADLIQFSLVLLGSLGPLVHADETALCSAVEAHDLQAVKAEVAAGISLNIRCINSYAANDKRQPRRQTPLARSIEIGQIDMAEYLMSAGSDPFFTSTFKVRQFQPVPYVEIEDANISAVIRSKQNSVLAIALQKGFDLNRVNPTLRAGIVGSVQKTPLEEAIDGRGRNNEAARMLIQAGADIYKAKALPALILNNAHQTIDKDLLEQLILAWDPALDPEKRSWAQIFDYLASSCQYGITEPAEVLRWVKAMKARGADLRVILAGFTSPFRAYGPLTYLLQSCEEIGGTFSEIDQLITELYSIGGDDWSTAEGKQIFAAMQNVYTRGKHNSPAVIHHLNKVLKSLK